MAGYHQHRKRGHDYRQQEAADQAEEECVDDLAIAAQYAVVAVTAPSPATFIINSTPKLGLTLLDDDNEIDLTSASAASDEEENSQENEKSLEVNHGDANKISKNDESSVDADDDGKTSDAEESDVDLAEELARMLEGDDDEEDANMPSSSSKPIMTAHEIDAYQADLAQLQNEFELNVAVLDEALMSSETCPQQLLVLAGRIQHYMVEDRTLVVLSEPGATLLQEGSLLVLRRQDVIDTATTMNEKLSSTIMPAIVPLGKILEVFGPVSQPLYSIRLVGAGINKPETKENEAKKGGAKGKQEESAILPTTSQPTTQSAQKNEKFAEADLDDSRIQMEGPDTDKSTQRSVEQKQEKDDITDVSTEKAVSTPRSEPTTSVEVTSTASTVTADLLPAIEQNDSWSKHGAYTKLLREHTNLPVYFLQDSTGTVTNVLDMAAVYRNSGRGCDASNLYDEEIMNAKEIDYSDDEKERMAKGQRNKKKGRGKLGGRGQMRGRQSNNNNRGPHAPHHHQGSYHFSSSFHQAPQGFYHGASITASGFAYPPGPPYGQQVPSHAPPQPERALPNYASPPPYYQSLYNASGQIMGYGTQGSPPPPPPGSPNQKQEEESDTVYYDFS